MGQRIVITENDRNHINGLYGFINEDGNSYMVNQLNNQSEFFKVVIEDMLIDKVLPNFTKDINKSMSEGIRQEKSTSARSKSVYGITGEISRPQIMITNLTFENMPEAKGLIWIDAKCTITEVEGGIKGEFIGLSNRDGNGWKGNPSYTDTQPVNLNGTVINVRVGADIRKRANDSDDIQGEDNRKLWLENIGIILNSETIGIRMPDFSKTKILFKLTNNNAVLSLDGGDIEKDISDTLNTELTRTMNSLKSSKKNEFRYSDYKEKYLSFKNLANLDFKV